MKKTTESQASRSDVGRSTMALTRESSRGESVFTTGKSSAGFSTLPARPRLLKSHSFIDSHRSSIARLSKIRKVKAAYDLDVMSLRTFTAKQKIYALFDPSADMPGKVYAQVSTAIAIVILFLILLSVVVFALETLPRFYNQANPVLLVIEAFCSAIFTIELTARCATHPNRSEFVRDPYTWIDFLSVLPFYIYLLVEVAGGASSQGRNNLVVLRLLKLIRVLRVLKLGQYSKPFQIVMFTLAKSVTALSLLVFFLSIGTVLFSSVLFIVETQFGQTWDDDERIWKRDDGVASPFQSIIDVFWWAMATLTTVGYGDAVPVTALGKVVGGLTIMTGLFVVAFPVILISHTFQEVISEINKLNMLNMYTSQDPQQTPSPQDDDLASVGSSSFKPASAKEPSQTIDSDQDLDSPSLSWGRMERRSTLTFSEPPTIPPLPPAPPCQPFDSVVCNFKWDRDGVSRPIFYAGQNHVGTHVFHYHPIFQPALQTDNSYHLDAVWVEQDAINLYMVHLKLYLDTGHARRHAADAVERTCLYSSNMVTYARELKKITTRSVLPPGCSFSTNTWHSPSGFITLDIVCESVDILKMLRMSLHSISVTFDCEFKPHQRTVDAQTILNINAAYQNGVVTQEERDAKISAELFTFTPMSVTVKLSPTSHR
eukprot:TRINITY_DN4056_c0_g8_i1.p1 TRINITY_DN4056_c0_g8~~TRINITY_DN4056_c0_g8_i1.p1  ORF type:complete len:656 (+),score=65.12 TRINITY_DN4056_c0_g8_i1:115-2082(+)